MSSLSSNSSTGGLFEGLGAGLQTGAAKQFPSLFSPNSSIGAFGPPTQSQVSGQNLGQLLYQLSLGKSPGLSLLGDTMGSRTNPIPMAAPSTSNILNAPAAPQAQHQSGLIGGALKSIIGAFLGGA